MSKIRNLIGIFGWKTGENSFGSAISYIEFFSQYGEVRIISPTEPIDDRFDLIVVPGGPDVDPNRYNAMPHFFTSKPDPIREYLDTKVLTQYIDLNIPVFGICRGLQSIAVLFGARLMQNMHHETSESMKRWDTVHELTLQDSHFEERYKKGRPGRLKVNSLHHQCVSDTGFPDELEILARHDGKGAHHAIEAIGHRVLPIYAVQYHPEELGFEYVSDCMIQELLERSPNYVEEVMFEEVENN